MITERYCVADSLNVGKEGIWNEWLNDEIIEYMNKCMKE